MTLPASTQNALTLIGRALIALLFIPEGIHQMTAFAGTVGYIASAGVPLPEVAAAISIVVHVGLGLALLVGFQARWAALGIAIFTVVITFIFHRYWDVPAAQAMMQKMSFFKNLATAGGLLAIVAWGPGGWSVDSQRGKS
jgi:putative oxidoreductase